MAALLPNGTSPLACGVLVLAAATAFACGRDSAEVGTPTPTPTPTPAPIVSDSHGPAVEPAGPTIVQVSLTPLVSPSQRARVVVVVAHPQGPEQIASGVLRDHETGTRLGSFEKTSTSTYDVYVPWSTLHAANPINFRAAGTRDVEAKFVDRDGRIGHTVIRLNLDCHGLSACDGRCTDLSTVDNCGACGRPCSGACRYGQCIPAKTKSPP